MKLIPQKNPFGFAIALSVGLHGLAFVFMGAALPWLHFTVPAETTPPKSDSPIVFNLIESPEALSTPRGAKHVSDKNVAASNPDAPEELPVGEAYAAGISQHSDYAAAGSDGRLHAPLPPTSVQGKEATVAQHGEGAAPPPEFHRELLLNPNASAPSQSSVQRPLLENRETRAPELGSFAINTYAWEFAPYLLWLKSRIEQNIFPPPAFTHMGMISGQTQLRFRIHPDGRLQALHVLRTAGHKSLMETSMRAVELSAPFRPLPVDFPEEFLEVTALFEYIVHRR